MAKSGTENLIAASTIDAVLQPISQAKGLPNAVYRDPTLFENERDVVLGTSWAAIAFCSELPTNGYTKPVDFMGLPLALMRNQSGEYKVFHNVCSHRGMRLVQGESEVPGSLRCPYHSWTYDLNGNLKGTPHIGGVGVHQVEGFSCDNHGLKEVRSSVWMGIIFVNLSSQAQEFEQFIAPLVQRWQSFTGEAGFDDLHRNCDDQLMELEVKANWKLAVENYCEAYHLPWVHPALNSYSPLSQHYNIMIDDCMAGQGSYTYKLSEVSGVVLPQFKQWPDEKIHQAEYISLYPNVLLGLQADHVFALILQPLSHDRTLEKLQLSYIGEHAISDSFAQCRDTVCESWRLVFSEDVFAVEGLQEGRESPAFEGGLFTPLMDAPTHHFHRWVASRYQSAVAAQTGTNE